MRESLNEVDIYKHDNITLERTSHCYQVTWNMCLYFSEFIKAPINMELLQLRCVAINLPK